MHPKSRATYEPARLASVNTPPPPPYHKRLVTLETLLLDKSRLYNLDSEKLVLSVHNNQLS